MGNKGKGRRLFGDMRSLVYVSFCIGIGIGTGIGIGVFGGVERK